MQIFNRVANPVFQHVRKRVLSTWYNVPQASFTQQTKSIESIISAPNDACNNDIICKSETENNSDELDLIESQMANVVSKIRDEAAKLAQQEHQIAKKESEFKAIQFADIITLDIGGTKYRTSWDTLTKDKGSLFTKIFNGEAAITKNDDGSYFIDRDGEIFKYILNYLRKQNINLINLNDEHFRMDLLTEAHFYKME
eukprot:226168_1